MDHCQPHENFWTARQSFQVVYWVKTKPRLAGNQNSFWRNQIWFCEGVYNKGYHTSIIDTNTKLDFLLIQISFELINNFGWLTSCPKIFMGLALVHFQMYWQLKQGLEEWPYENSTRLPLLSTYCSNYSISKIFGPNYGYVKIMLLKEL